MSIAQNNFSSNDFRKALGAFTTGVTVVTTKGRDGCDTGLTANSFNSVSLDPPMVLWSLARSSLNLAAFTAAKYFAVHILSSDQQEISTRFATRGIDKFSGIDVERGPGDIPLLKQYTARFICETAYRYEGGDHIIFVGTVVRFDHSDRAPLVFHSGQYGQLLKAPIETGSTPALDALCIAALNNAPGQQAIEFEKRWVTWGELRSVADAVWRAIDVLGVKTARIAFVARNTPEAVAAFLVMLAKRCSIRMIYSFQSSEAIAREIEKSDADLFVASSADYNETLFDALRKKNMSAIGLKVSTVESILSVAARQAEAEIAAQVTILTSGTTGTPKPFSLSYETIAKHIVGAKPDVQEKREERYALTPVVLIFPVSNISGLYSTLPPLLTGQRVVLLDRFTVPAWCDYVQRHRPQFTGLPPAGVQMLIDAQVPRDVFASVRALGSGAAPLAPSVHKQFEELYGVPILLSYGATEFGGPVTAMNLDLHAKWGDKKFGSVGRAFQGVKLRVVDPNSGAVLPPNTEGILEVISPRIGPEWLRTSDVAVIDADDFLFLRGRADGAIMRGGFKLLPSTIEHALLQHPAVSAVSVVGVKDHRLGEVPGSAIELKPDANGIDAAALEEHVRKLIPATHVPVHWKIVERLPRTISMKIDLGAVRKLFENN